MNYIYNYLKKKNIYKIKEMTKGKKKENNIKIIIIVIISVLVIGGVLTWGFLTNLGSGKKIGTRKIHCSGWNKERFGYH